MDFDTYDYEQQQKLNSLTHCVICGEPIQDDYYWDWGDGPVCEGCLTRKYRKDNE